MSKLLDKVGEREECRARLLEGRRALAQRRVEYTMLENKIEELAGQIERDSKRLVELTREVAQLAHADLAGVVGKHAAIETAPAEAEKPSQVTPTA